MGVTGTTSLENLIAIATDWWFEGDRGAKSEKLAANASTEAQCLRLKYGALSNCRLALSCDARYRLSQKWFAVLRIKVMDKSL